MKLKQISLEAVLYAAALFIAGAVRFFNLGAQPLSNVEAAWALQAMDVVRSGASAAVGANPGYVSLTGLLFGLLGTSNFLARFWPALAGVLLVFVPLFFRASLGRRIASIAAFGLALDPGLVAASRAAGGNMMAVGFGLLAVAALLTRRPALAGLLGGLAVLSGPAWLLGGLGLAGAWAASRWMARAGNKEQGNKEEGNWEEGNQGVGDWAIRGDGGQGEDVLVGNTEVMQNSAQDLAPAADPLSVEAQPLPQSTNQPSAQSLPLPHPYLSPQSLIADCPIPIHHGPTILFLGTLFFRAPQALGGLGGAEIPGIL